MKKIIDTVEKDGETLTIWHSDSLVNIPPLILMFECYLELLKSGMTLPSMPFRNGSSSIWIENSNNEVMAGQVYEYIADRSEGWITLVFTDPKYRRRGLNYMSHEYLKDIIKKRGGVSIGSIIHSDNEHVVAGSIKKGLMPEYYRTIQWI
jgi:hypothetical protein